MPYARIAITLPKDVLARLDQRARQSGRARSQVIVEAINAFLRTSVVSESRPAYGGDDIGAARLAQLERDLAKSPAERLHAAEAAARLARRARHPRGARQQIIGFDSYEDFYEWKKANRA
jgi:predicted transcriptional regulator